MGILDSLKNIAMDKEQNNNQQNQNNTANGGNQNTNSNNANNQGLIKPNNDYKQNQFKSIDDFYDKNKGNSFVNNPSNSNQWNVENELYKNQVPPQNNFNNNNNQQSYYNHDNGYNYSQNNNYQRPNFNDFKGFHHEFNENGQPNYQQQMQNPMISNQFNQNYQQPMNNNNMDYQNQGFQQSINNNGINPPNYQQQMQNPMISNQFNQNYQQPMNNNIVNQQNINGNVPQPYNVPAQPIVSGYGEVQNQGFSNTSLVNQQKQERYKFNDKFGKRYMSEMSGERIPRAIAKEIKAEKLRASLMIFMGSVLSAIMIMFIALFFYAKETSATMIIGISVGYIPNAFLTIIGLIIFLAIFLIGTFELKRIRAEAKKYVFNLTLGQHTIPYFLINNYKKMVKRQVVMNWISFTVYGFGLVVLGLLYGLNAFAGVDFYIGFWNLGTVAELTTAITVNIIILISMLAAHIGNIVVTKKRKANIIGYYGYQIVDQQELDALRKRTNKTCLIVFICFIIIVTLLITIPWLIIRRRRSGKGIPVLGRLFSR